MTDHISFLCYSDIHHHEYQNGLTGEDVEAVEEEFNQLLKTLDVDFWIFAGDRFLSRNPLDVSRLRAERALKKHHDTGKPGIMLLGNHDQWTKNPYGGHTMRHINLFRTDLKNIHVIDTARTHLLNVRGLSVAVHGIPAGHAIPQFTFNPQVDFNICIFHGLMIGSLFQSGMSVTEGIQSKVLDLKEFDIVLGGDNHKHQALPLKNTRGFYIGAPMQHNWGDAGSSRGFLHVKLYRDSDANHSMTNRWVECHHLPSHAPQFIKYEIRVDKIEELVRLIEEANNTWKNNIITINVSGPHSVLKDIIPSEWAQKIKDKVGTRSINLKLHYDLDRTTTHPVRQKTDAEEWKEFLITMASSQIKELNLNKLEQMGLDFINNA